MSSNPASSYALMRQYYKKSNEYLVQALEIDESGQGDKATAVALYSKAVVELKNGIACSLNIEGADNLAARNLSKKMVINLDNARDRIGFLTRGGGLKIKSNTGTTIQQHPSTNAMDSSAAPPVHEETPSSTKTDTIDRTQPSSQYQPFPPNQRGTNVVKSEFQSTSSQQSHPSRAAPRDTSSSDAAKHAGSQKLQLNSINQSKPTPKSPTSTKDKDSLHLQPPKSDHKENATVTCVNKKHSTAPVIVTTDESKSQSSPTHQPHPIKQSESLSATPQGKQPSHSPHPKSPQQTPSTKRDNKSQSATPRGLEKKSPSRRAPSSTNKLDHSKHLSQNSKGAGKKSAVTGKKTPAVGKTKPDNKAILADLKGVDKQFAETILDEVVESDSLLITWDDIVGLELPKRMLQEIVILPALRPELFTGLRSPCRGLLLFGPPGNGKTMLAKAVAHESQAKFFNISASSLTSKWVGNGEKLVRAMFVLARKMQPSVIFLDEVDALLSHRGDSENDAMRRLKNEFLQSFDGMHTTEGERILVMAATNRPQELDDAALRRFGKRIYIPLPEQQARKSVLAKLIAKHNHSITEKQLQTLAFMTEGYSASDLKFLASDTSLGPIRELDLATLKSVPADMVRPITFQDFELSLHQSRTSVSMELIKGLEEWNANYGVSA